MAYRLLPDWNRLGAFGDGLCGLLFGAAFLPDRVAKQLEDEGVEAFHTPFTKRWRS